MPLRRSSPTDKAATAFPCRHHRKARSSSGGRPTEGPFPPATQTHLTAGLVPLLCAIIVSEGFLFQAACKARPLPSPADRVGFRTDRPPTRLCHRLPHTQKHRNMFLDGVTEKMMLVAEPDLWIGHGPRSSFPPRRLRTGSHPMLSNSSTMETLAFKASKSIGSRRTLPFNVSLRIGSACGADCGSCANSFMPKPMGKPATRQHSSSGTEPEKRN